MPLNAHKRPLVSYSPRAMYPPTGVNNAPASLSEAPRGIVVDTSADLVCFYCKQPIDPRFGRCFKCFAGKE